MASRTGKTLAGKRVLVAGGSSGVGLICAERMGALGARTVLLARGRIGLEQAAAAVPGCAGTIRADVGEAEHVRAAAHEAAEMMDGIDVVVCAASAGACGPFGELAVEDHMRTIETTLLGTMNLVHATLPYLLSSGGTLIALGSVAGRVPTPWMSGYAAAEHGIRGFVRSLACELRAQGASVRVLLISPGPRDRPLAVATEVVRAVRDPRGRMERTVGVLSGLCARLDGAAPELSLRALGALEGRRSPQGIPAGGRGLAGAASAGRRRLTAGR